MKNKQVLSVSGLIISLGIVFGDIGTSPLYVVQAIANQAHQISTPLIIGAISCIIWTLTIQTTIKYVILALRADNQGEGGIFSLYALLRRYYKWSFLFAIIGGAMLLADGIITPSITVVSAIEGLKIMNPHINVLIIAIVIIISLFVVQQFGTQRLGKTFGSIMMIWFLSLFVFGIIQVIHKPTILNAFNPLQAYHFLKDYPESFIMLGAIFLSTTGAEALYSDLGHCGKENIRITWIFVKTALIFNYLGQGAWLIQHDWGYNNPFYTIVPYFLIIPVVILSTMAAIIASQALISGSFTLISEAIALNFWPKLQKVYPTSLKGQVYIPAINWMLMVGCIIVILLFKSSSNMEAAYGLAITITMLMTTILLSLYLRSKRVHLLLVSIFFITFSIVEGCFLYANLFKFKHGGWFTLMLALFFFIIMYSWYNARKIRNRYLTFYKLDDYVNLISDISQDSSITKYASNLVFLTHANNKNEIEAKIIHSILYKRPKRADRYWFLHVNIVDNPNELSYEITTIKQNIIYRLDFNIGFKVETRLNLYFRQVLHELSKEKEIDLVSQYVSLRKHQIESDFTFILVERISNFKTEFSWHDKLMLTLEQLLRRISTSDVKFFGLDLSSIVVETIPLTKESPLKKHLIRKYTSKNSNVIDY